MDTPAPASWSRVSSVFGRRLEKLWEGRRDDRARWWRELQVKLLVVGCDGYDWSRDGDPVGSERVAAADVDAESTLADHASRDLLGPSMTFAVTSPVTAPKVFPDCLSVQPWSSDQVALQA